MQLLFDNTFELTHADVERLYQSAMFYADSVAIRASANCHSAEWLQRKVKELREIGALKTWAHEYEVTDGGLLKRSYSSGIFDGPCDFVITPEQSKTVVESLDDAILPERESIYSKKLSSREGVGELVQCRQSLICVSLGASLGLDGVAASNRRNSGVWHDIKTVADPGTVQAVATKVVDVCKFDRLASLPVAAVVECRKHMPAFRDYIEQITDGRKAPDAMAVANHLLEEYESISCEFQSPMPDEPSELSNRSWEVLGFKLSKSILLKGIKRAFSWNSGKESYHPLLLISTIKSHTKKGSR